MIKLLVIRPNEEPEVRTDILFLKDSPGLFAAVRSVICGDVERVGARLATRAGHVVHREGWVNEDGYTLRLEGNSLGSRLVGQPIVGTLVMELEETDEPVFPSFKRRGMAAGE